MPQLRQGAVAGEAAPAELLRGWHSQLRLMLQGDAKQDLRAVSKRLEDKDSAATKILAVEPILEANFSTTAALRQKQTKARRWAPNPEEYWGPKAAARGKKKARK